ncbi:MAG: hypothetical protein RJA46_1230, partial [Pseudomonadota bacterium]
MTTNKPDLDTTATSNSRQDLNYDASRKQKS